MAEKGGDEQGKKTVASAEDILKSLTMKDVQGLAKVQAQSHGALKRDIACSSEF